MVSSFATCDLAHPPQKCRLVSAVGIQPGVGVAGGQVEEPTEQHRLLAGRVDPEGVPLLLLPNPHDHADQVVEAAIRVALDVKVDPVGRDRQFGAAQDVNLPLADRQRLQSMRVDGLPLLQLFVLLGGRKVQASCPTVKMPRFAYLATSASPIPRRRFRSSLATASAWHLLRNSQAWQWSLSSAAGPFRYVPPGVREAADGLAW